MHRAIFGRMGRTGQKLRANPPSSQDISSNASRQPPGVTSPRSHPYALSLSAHQRHASSNLASVARQPESRLQSYLTMSATTSASASEATTPTINSSSVVEKKTGFLDDDWSPFSDPSIKQCMTSGFQQTPQESLFQRSRDTSAYTPMYTPICPQGYSTQGYIYNPDMYTRTTYEGYHFPREQITVNILDIDSGEYLKQFPQH